MRHGGVAPAVPALRAALRCSRFAGSRRTRFAQTTASPVRETLRSSAAQRGRPHRTAHRAWPGGVRPVRVHGVGVPVSGGPLRHRRAAERWADQGSQLFERSEFCETPPVVSSTGKPEGPVTSARRRQGLQRRSPKAASAPGAQR
ncbi:hypothetical protein DBV14_08695 [Variovorax sp. KBW07]|nr:hypothetical protein DBV14_08695 [Variovorax sp. KBW07]